MQPKDEYSRDTEHLYHFSLDAYVPRSSWTTSKTFVPVEYKQFKTEEQARLDLNQELRNQTPL
jgi:hypothetical protein